MLFDTLYWTCHSILHSKYQSFDTFLVLVNEIDLPAEIL